jgi:hypothetical protein
MRITRAATVLYVCALIPLSLGAQQSVPTPAQSDPQAVSLLQKSLAAQVGTAQVADATLSGTAQRIAGSVDETGTSALTAMSAGESKLVLSFPSGTFTEIRTPAGQPPPSAPAGATIPTGAWIGPDGIFHAIVAQNLSTDPTWFFPAFTIGRLISSQNYVISYVGQESHGGQQVLHLSASQQFWPSASGQAPVPLPFLIEHVSQLDVYLDPTSLLPIALDFNEHPDNNASFDIPVEIQFSAYQSVSGIRIPFRIQKYVNRNLALDLGLATAALNTGLSPASFAIQ